MNLTLVPASQPHFPLLSQLTAVSTPSSTIPAVSTSIPYKVVSKEIKMIVFRLLPQCPGMSMILSNVAFTCYPLPFYLNVFTLQKIPQALKLYLEIFSPWKL